MISKLRQLTHSTLFHRRRTYVRQALISSLVVWPSNRQTATSHLLLLHQYNLLHQCDWFLKAAVIERIGQNSAFREPISTMTVNRITVLGGTGFVGTHLVVKLARMATEVVVLTRRSQRFVSLKVLSNVRVLEADIHDSASLRSAIGESDVVINLVGILNQSATSGPHSFNGAHADLTKNVVQTAIDAAVPRYLHMSALNADAENGSSEYLRSKGLAENYLSELACMPRCQIVACLY